MLLGRWCMAAHCLSEGCLASGARVHSMVRCIYAPGVVVALHLSVDGSLALVHANAE